jgi:hypothetical protein
MKSFFMGCAALALVAGCGASVNSTVTPGANLGQYKTWSFHTPKYRAGKPETPAEQELRAALKADLANKGLAEAAPGTMPNFLVAYHVKEQQQLDVENVGYFWGPSDVYTYTQGTLIVDFIDPRTNQVFWRGTASQVVNNPDTPNLTHIDKAVAKLVNQYPVMMASTPRPAG